MKMIFAVVADRFIRNLVDELMDVGISVTEISSTGGFLSQGNTTIVIGVKEEKMAILDKVFTKVITKKKDDPKESGAHFFAVDLEQGLHI
ncbi:cyclic-di-AMP receptor [Peptoniphilus sp. KCTC 25270]|uniref:cyclic-di-AMP receptor n=1 Tax=Peptoniphilus sp. KCTC 25270 TaxID=2897414 RepID=UPI001E612B7F|nr:cyclic-di-AMP receptor [Peptoniphilus sp. KCTC 25270]MCD1147890.1 cyclic-di-AMP receptor [Peptoniphilus sp. KCTC 25270]